MAGPLRTIHYEALVEAYAGRLDALLRSFSAGLEGIESWVPASDPLLSVAGLLDAVHAAKEAGLALTMSRETMNSHTLVEWEELGARYGALRIDASEPRVRMEFLFHSANTLARTRAAATAVASPGVVAQRTAQIARRARPHDVIVRATPSRLPAAYRQRVLEAAAACVHLGSSLQQVQHGVGATRVEVSADGWELDALISPEHIVLQARHRGAAVEDERGVLELLCRVAEGLPILEWADHGALLVMQNALDPRQPPPVSGVPQPENTAQLFVRANALSRALFSRYCAATGYADLDNRFDRLASGAWLRLGPDDRVRLLNQHFAAACAAAGFEPGDAELAELKEVSRVVVRLSAGVSPSRRRGLLFRLERELADRVEPSLSVEREARKDLNVIRRL